MKVALISRYLPPQGGGIAAYTEKTARGLAAAGQEVHVITEVTDGTAKVEVIDGVTVHRLARSAGRPREMRLLARAWAVRERIRQLRPLDVVQACEWDAEACLYAARPEAPLITRLATPHALVAELNSVAARERWRQAGVGRLERWQAARSSLVISPSRALAARLTRDWRLDPSRIRVVPTGVHLPPLPPAPRPAAPYLLFFGRLEVRKGVHTWLKALPGVIAAHPTLRAKFVGEDLGIAGRSFLDYAKEVAGSVWDRLEFVGHLPQAELFPIVAAAELVVLPSRWENLPNVCLEAMALGRPVLATSGSAFEEMIEDGVSGFLVPPDDATALAAAALEALGDPARLVSVAAAARRRAEDFDLESMVNRLLSVYEELVERHPIERAT